VAESLVSSRTNWAASWMVRVVVVMGSYYRQLTGFHRDVRHNTPGRQKGPTSLAPRGKSGIATHSAQRRVNPVFPVAASVNSMAPISWSPSLR
jgi:hypothetical protein